MLEIKCQGANLTRFFTIWASQSPWAEVLQEGHCVGRTRPHQGGDKNPRWDDPPFVLDPSRGQQLVFRVLIPSSSVMGHKDVLCGEGTLAVPELMRQQQQFVLPLHKGGDPTGFLSFQWRILRDTREAPSRQPQPERLERPERAHGIMHKDLKPENVMMSSAKGAPIQDLHVVVVDFGLAQMLSPEGRGTEIAGTPPFMSPEVWAGNFSQSCDIWSCGVMLFFMLSGTYPFMAKRIEEFPAAVAREPEWSRIGGASSEAQYICFDMLCKREADRPPAQELLSNAWFRRFGLGSSSSDIQKLGRGLLQVKERSSFERFVARLVATQMDAGQLKRINEAFRTFDLDKDGSLSRDELVRGLTTLGASAEEAQQVMEELDVGKTGRISYTEFLAGVTDLRQRSPMERDKLLKLAWQQFAPDQRGMVKTGSIQAALAARGLTVAELPKEFLKELRRGSAGEISFEAFRGLFAGDESCCVMNSFVGSLPRN